MLAPDLVSLRLRMNWPVEGLPEIMSDTDFLFALGFESVIVFGATCVSLRLHMQQYSAVRYLALYTVHAATGVLQRCYNFVSGCAGCRKLQLQY